MRPFGRLADAPGLVYGLVLRIFLFAAHVERRLRAELDIPVFNDDQHGTAIVVLAALINALRVVRKDIAKVQFVISGVGAAGSAIIRLLKGQGATMIIGCDSKGAVYDAPEG